MPSVSTLIWLAIAVPLVTSVIAAVLKPGPAHSVATYLLGGRDISRGHYIATMTGSNAALANILFLYVYWGYVYGIWAWFWGSLFWGLGFLFFSILAAKTRLYSLLSSDRTEFSYNEIMGTEYRSRHILRVTALVSGLAFLFLMSLELNVGAKIFSGFSSNATPPNPYILALVIGSVLAMYTAFGGMRAVIITDVLQLFFVLIGASAMLVTISLMLPANATILSLVRNSASTTPIFEWSWRYVPFVFGSILSWGLWFICTMDMWQRTLAVKVERRVIGVKAILPSFLMLSFVTLSGVLAGVLLKSQTGSPFPTKYPLVDLLHSAFAQAQTNDVLAIALAVAVSGLVAAMLSTVDTYLVIVAHCFVVDLPSRYKEGLSKRLSLDPSVADETIQRTRRFLAVIPFIAVAIFYIIERLGKQDTFTLYMIAGSIPLSLLPLSLAAIPASGTWPQWRERNSFRMAIFALVSVALSMSCNFLLARHALATYDARSFGLLYFIPTLAAGIAALPLLSRLWRK